MERGTVEWNSGMVEPKPKPKLLEGRKMPNKANIFHPYPEGL